MVFLSVFWFSSPSRKVCSWIFQCFRGHNLKKLQQTTLDWEWWRLCHSFINLTERRERRVMCQQLIGDIKHKKNIIFFYTSCYGFCQGWKSLNSTIVNVINYKLNLLAQAILRNIDPRTVLTQAQINNILK